MEPRCVQVAFRERDMPEVLQGHQQSQRLAAVPSDCCGLTEECPPTFVFALGVSSVGEPEERPSDHRGVSAGATEFEALLTPPLHCGVVAPSQCHVRAAKEELALVE